MRKKYYVVILTALFEQAQASAILTRSLAIVARSEPLVFVYIVIA